MTKMEKMGKQGKDTGCWLTGIANIASHLNVGKTTISNLINAGKLPGVRKFGGLWMVRLVDVEAFVLHSKPFRQLTKKQKLDIREGLTVGVR